MAVPDGQTVSQLSGLAHTTDLLVHLTRNCTATDPCLFLNCIQQVEQLKMDNVAYPLALPGSEYAGLRPPQNHDGISSPNADLTAGFASLLGQYGNNDPAVPESNEDIAVATATTSTTIPTITTGVKKNAYGSYTYTADRAGPGTKSTNASASTSTSQSPVNRGEDSQLGRLISTRQTAKRMQINKLDIRCRECLLGMAMVFGMSRSASSPPSSLPASEGATADPRSS